MQPQVPLLVSLQCVALGPLVGLQVRLQMELQVELQVGMLMGLQVGQQERSCYRQIVVEIPLQLHQDPGLVARPSPATLALVALVALVDAPALVALVALAANVSGSTEELIPAVCLQQPLAQEVLVPNVQVPQVAPLVSAKDMAGQQERSVPPVLTKEIVVQREPSAPPVLAKEMVVQQEQSAPLAAAVRQVHAPEALALKRRALCLELLAPAPAGADRRAPACVATYVAAVTVGIQPWTSHLWRLQRRRGHCRWPTPGFPSLTTRALHRSQTFPAGKTESQRPGAQHPGRFQKLTCAAPLQDVAVPVAPPQPAAAVPPGLPWTRLKLPLAVASQQAALAALAARCLWCCLMAASGRKATPRGTW